MSNISIEKWRFNRITIFLSGRSIVDIGIGGFIDGKYVFLTGSFYVAWLSDRAQTVL